MNWQASHVRRRWKILIAAIVLLGVPLVWLAVFLPGNRVTLPDGREFTVLAVTYGTNHQMTFGPGWLRPFARLLPQSVRGPFGVTVTRFQTSTPALVAWGGWRHDSPTNQAARLASVSDVDGRETEPRHPDHTTYHRTTGLVMAWAFPNFPCQQSSMDFSIHDFGTAFKPVRRATLRVANPARRAPAELKPVPLPAEVRDGPWTMRLVRLASSAPGKRAPDATMDFERTWGTAFFQILREGQPDEAWTVEAMTCRDAAGHVVEVKPVHRQRMGDEWFWLFSEPLWPADAAIRVEAEFARVKAFPTEDIFTTPFLAVPTNDVPERIATKWERHGVMLAAVQLQRVTSGPSGFGEFRATHQLLLTALPPTRGVHLRLIEVRDVQDRPVPHSPEYATPGGQQMFSLNVPVGVREVLARVAIGRSRFAELVVKPD